MLAAGPTGNGNARGAGSPGAPPIPPSIKSKVTPGDRRQLTLPDKLTLSRVVMVPVLIMLWCASFGLGPVALRAVRTGVFAAAAVTDFLDGYLARKMDLCTPFGAFLDPVADKLMVAAALMLLAGDWGRMVAVPAALIIGREIGVSALREWMAE